MNKVWTSGLPMAVLSSPGTFGGGHSMWRCLWAWLAAQPQPFLWSAAGFLARLGSYFFYLTVKQVTNSQFRTDLYLPFEGLGSWASQRTQPPLSYEITYHWPLLFSVLFSSVLPFLCTELRKTNKQMKNYLLQIHQTYMEKTTPPALCHTEGKKH